MITLSRYVAPPHRPNRRVRPAALALVAAADHDGDRADNGHDVDSDGRETDLTGEEANNLYSATGAQLLIEGGMRPAMFGNVIIDPAAGPVPATSTGSRR